MLVIGAAIVRRDTEHYPIHQHFELLLSEVCHGLNKFEPPTLIAVKTATLVITASQNNADPGESAFCYSTTKSDKHKR